MEVAPNRPRRALEATAGFDVAVPAELREVLGRAAGADVRFRLAVGNPNEPVRVTPPRGARRAAELPRG